MKIFKISLIVLILTLYTLNISEFANAEDDKSCGREVELEIKDGNYYFDGTLIVNKVYPLDEGYNPGADSKLKENIDKMISDASKEDLSIGITGDASKYGFRSYSTQETLYNDYVERDGEEEANKYSAKPGSSEHQTGLAVDVKDKDDSSTDLKESFGDTDAGKWIAENAHKYGLIIRYPKGKEDVHGYIYEPWHLRYVGDIAKTLKSEKLTLEEYFGIEDDGEPRKEGGYEVDSVCLTENSASGGSNSETGNVSQGRGEYTGNLENDPFIDEGVVQNSTGLKEGNEGTVNSQETYAVSQWIDLLVNLVLIVLIVILALYMVLLAVVILLISFTNSYVSDNKAIRWLVGAEFIDKMVGEGVKGVFWKIVLRFLIGSFVLIVAITGMINGLQYILIEFVKNLLKFVGL